jgi:hypothetical protein
VGRRFQDHSAQRSTLISRRARLLIVRLSDCLIVFGGSPQATALGRLRGIHKACGGWREDDLRARYEWGASPRKYSGDAPNVLAPNASRKRGLPRAGWISMENALVRVTAVFKSPRRIADGSAPPAPAVRAGRPPRQAGRLPYPGPLTRKAAPPLRTLASWRLRVLAVSSPSPFPSAFAGSRKSALPFPALPAFNIEDIFSTGSRFPTPPAAALLIH